jgi:protein SCO1/2
MNTTTRPKRSKALLIALWTVVFVAGIWMAIVWQRPRESFRLTTLPPSAYTSDFSLIDFEGRPRTLADYRGRVVVMFFGFARCPDVCPTELFKLARVMKRLGPASAHVQVLFVTLDPERDTPAVLKSYVTAFDPRFVGLTGTPAQIDEAATDFYVAHAKVPSGNDYTIDHSSATYVLDARGHRRLIGTMDTSIDDFVHDIIALAQS